MPWACWWISITHSILLSELSFSCLPHLQLFSPHLQKMGAGCDQKTGERRVECNQHPCIQSCCSLSGEQRCASFLQLHNDFTLPNAAMENSYENIIERAFWTLDPKPNFQNPQESHKVPIFEWSGWCDGTAGSTRIKWSPQFECFRVTGCSFCSWNSYASVSEAVLPPVLTCIYHHTSPNSFCQLQLNYRCLLNWTHITGRSRGVGSQESQDGKGSQECLLCLLIVSCVVQFEPWIVSNTLQFCMLGGTV